MEVNKLTLYSISNFLVDFLERRGLKFPTHKPLYEYQVSEKEYNELLIIIRKWAAKPGFTNDKAASAAFCLFGAEWYRRDFKTEDGWSWEPIFKKIGHQFSAVELSKIIPKGLEDYWGRPISIYDSERRNFLGSILSEGGLPFNALQESGNRFQTLFSEILKRFESTYTDDFSLNSLVKRALEKTTIPLVFKEQASVELIAKMARQLVDLVRTHNLENSLTPALDLDRSYPKWRESFPIPLDVITGTELLNGLLLSASKEAKKYRGKTENLSAKHFLKVEKNEVWVKVHLPLLAHFKLKEPVTSTRFDMAIFEGEKLVRALGPTYASLSGLDAKVRLKTSSEYFKRKNYSEELRLVASIGGEVVADEAISKSSLSLETSPIGFININDEWELAGQGTFSVSGSKLLILVSECAEVVSENCSVEQETLLNSNTVIWKLEGEGVVYITQSDDLYRIGLKEQSSDYSGIELAGKKLQGYRTEPSNTFLSYLEIEKDLTRSFQDVEHSIYLNKKITSNSSFLEKLGVQWLVVKDKENNTFLRRKIGFLPSDLQVEIVPTKKPSVGSIRFTTSVNCLFRVVTESIDFNQKRESDTVELFLTTKQNFPPSQILVEITPNLEADPILIELPFPTFGVLSVNKEGEKLPKQLSTEDLLGSRLYLFSQPDCAVKYHLIVSLRGGMSRRAYYDWTYNVQPQKPKEVSLYPLKGYIEELLSLEEGIDQVVELTISSMGANESFRIHRHSTRLIRDYERNTINTSNFKAGEECLPDPVLMSIAEPERKPISILPRLSEGVATGEFDIPAMVDKGGPWLIVPKENSIVSFRPLFLLGSHNRNELEGEIKSLQKAVLAFDHKSIPNVFMPVLLEMSKNPNHSGWQFLEKLFENYKHLPLGTFEVWKSLSLHHNAFAMAFFKFNMSSDFLSRVEKDFPIIWESFPLQAIEEAQKIYFENLETKGLPSFVLEKLKKKFLTDLEVEFPSYGGSLNIWLEKSEYPVEMSMPKPFIDSAIHTWYQSVLHNHTEESWPDDFGNRLYRWHSLLDKPLISLDTVLTYRNAVVYLPVYLAAVAAGLEPFETLFSHEPETIFYLRRIRDFDTEWFSSIYQLALLRFYKERV